MIRPSQRIVSSRVVGQAHGRSHQSVLHALLSDPTREYYGLELSETSGIPSSTVPSDPEEPIKTGPTTVDSNATASILLDQDLLFLCHVCAISAILNRISPGQID
jgi:hypothetical protein